MKKKSDGSVRAAVAAVRAGKAALIDVRTYQEWGEGHAAEAVHFDVARMANGEAPPFPKDMPIYLYCRSGNRSDIARAILLRDGFADVTNIGGLYDWEAAGGGVAH